MSTVQSHGSGTRGGAVAAAVVGAIITVLGSIGVFWLTHVGGPAVMGGTITDVQLTSGDPCCTFSVRVKLEGFKDRECTVYWSLVDVYTGFEEMRGPGLGFVSEADVDQARGDIEVPVRSAGTFVVLFFVIDPDGVELDRYTTDEFDVE
jgi:hypothetical protein